MAFDPVAQENLERIMPEVKFADKAADACKDADALAIITEWDEFRQIDLEKIKKSMKTPIIFDGRNIYDPTEMKEKGFDYYSIGR